MVEQDRANARPRPGLGWLGRLFWLLVGSVLTVSVLVVGCLAAAPSVLQHRGSWPWERALGRWAIDRTATSGAAAVTTPTRGRVDAQTGRIVYVGSCAQCHGADADGKGWLGQLMYPPASPLNDADTRARSDAELYWIIANGLSFVGMPGFRDRLSEEQIWSVVSYLRDVQRGNGGTLPAIPTPSADDLATADPRSSGAARGAALYIALGCVECHGANGTAPGRLQLRASDRRAVRAIRNGTEEGMPAFPVERLSDDDLQALLDYIASFRTAAR
ncbi:MAG: c-type cytochrome [Thermomicrobium sp.]|nr:c-type cytochrome [Thermomicrobium sp.]MDW7981225.1 c-type cytochrome [Thermomicrobium sp.]